MNFLAHFQVSPQMPEAIVGAFLGDFVRGDVSQNVDLTPTIRQSIMLHRYVDGFTDSHPIWQRSAGRLVSERRRLAGIIIDVIYDHYLCLHWDEFSKVPLEEFVEFCYESLLSRMQMMEVNARRVVRRMRDHDWLASYHEIEGIELAFRRLSYRSRALEGIEHASIDFRAHYDELEADFVEYYPLLQQFAKDTWEKLTQEVD